MNPANVVLDQVIVGNNSTENEDNAVRFDFTYNFDWKALSSVDLGVRYNESSSVFNNIQDRIGGFSRGDESFLVCRIQRVPGGRNAGRQK